MWGKVFVTEGSEEEDKEKKTTIGKTLWLFTLSLLCETKISKHENIVGKLQDQQLGDLNIIPSCAVDLPCDFEDVFCNPV